MKILMKLFYLVKSLHAAEFGSEKVIFHFIQWECFLKPKNQFVFQFCICTCTLMQGVTDDIFVELVFSL